MYNSLSLSCGYNNYSMIVSIYSNMCAMIVLILQCVRDLFGTVGTDAQLIFGKMLNGGISSKWKDDNHELGSPHEARGRRKPLLKLFS